MLFAFSNNAISMRSGVGYLERAGVNNYVEQLGMIINSEGSGVSGSGDAKAERRAAHRYPLRQGAYVLLYKSEDRGFQIVGQIIELSYSGFSFYYVTQKEHEQRLVYDNQYDIIIFSLYRMLRLRRYRIVYDIELTALPSGRVSARRCGVKFERLKQSQNIELEQIIRFNAI
jgi:hypothetical protein